MLGHDLAVVFEDLCRYVYRYYNLYILFKSA